MSYWQTYVAIGLFIAAVAWSAFQWDLAAFGQLGVGGLLMSMGVGLLTMATQGLVLRYVLHKGNGTRISWADTLSLPFAMHLWTFIIPIKGGFMYSSFMVSRKYETPFSNGYSSGLAMFIGSLFVNGLFGLILYNLTPTQSRIFPLFFGLFLSVPLAVAIVSRMVMDLQYTGSSQVVSFLLRVASDLAALTRAPKALTVVTVLSTLNMLLHCLWFWAGAKALGIEVSAVNIGVVTLVLRVLFLIRLLPGNLGIQEVLTAGAFAAAGVSWADGMAMALLLRMEAVLLTMAIGIPAMMLNAHHLNVSSVREMYGEMMKG
jgi:uncharacterized membrane protein YbhN (UPF0104 family)